MTVRNWGRHILQSSPIDFIRADARICWVEFSSSCTRPILYRGSASTKSTHCTKATPCSYLSSSICALQLKLFSEHIAYIAFLNVDSAVLVSSKMYDNCLPKSVCNFLQALYFRQVQRCPKVWEAPPLIFASLSCHARF